MPNQYTDTGQFPKGTKFHRLKVIGFHHKDSRSRRWYSCICDCGKKLVVHGSAMKSGNTKSCGCMIADSANKRRLPNNAGVINHILLQYKRHAKDRGIEWDISRIEFEALIRSKCHYCGEPAGNLKKTKNLREGFRHNGIDRLDPSKPYTPSNGVASCGTCNRAKGSMSEDVFWAWISKCHANKPAQPVVYASDCQPCPDCGEPWCATHAQQHYADCPRVGPNSKD